MSIPLCVASSFQESEGTWIMERNVDEAVFIRSVASDDDLAVLTVEGRTVERELMDALSGEGIRTTAMVGAAGASFHIEGARLPEAVEICRKLAGCSVSVNKLSRVSVIGPAPGTTPVCAPYQHSGGDRHPPLTSWRLRHRRGQGPSAEAVGASKS